MAEITRPDMSNIWASGGAILAPSTSKVQVGWTAEIPPHQWENWVQNRQDLALGYIFQRGIPEWNSATEYFSEKSFVQWNGNTYKAISNSLNITPADNAKWRLWGLRLDQIPSASTTEKGLIEIGTEAEVKALLSSLLAVTPSTLGAVLATFGSDLPKIKTYEEAIALNSDIGPIVVVGMDGIWEWTTSAYFTGYRHPRCGHWEDGWTPTPLPFQIEAHGANWSESDPKQRRVIARFRESGLVVPIGSWVAGQGMIADLGGGVWKGVDYRNMHKRAAGTDADTANVRPLGTKQGDTNKSHSHKAKYNNVSLQTGGSNVNQILDATSGVTTVNTGADGGAETRGVGSAVGAYVHA